jgi:hypothetical protein
MRRVAGRPRRRGQALVEFALVFPIFLLLVFSLIVYGLYVFYNEQLANAAREAARYAVVHSATAQCPVVSQLDPIETLQGEGYRRDCDSPENGWPNMTDAARSKVFGMASSQVSMTACWSGYIDPRPPASCSGTAPSAGSIPRLTPRPSHAPLR